MTKPTKLLAFAQTSGRGAIQSKPELVDKAASSAPAAIGAHQTANHQSPSAVEAKKKDRVATNLRLTRDQWRRVHEFALEEETTVQELAIRGLSRLFEERGLPRL